MTPALGPQPRRAPRRAACDRLGTGPVRCAWPATTATPLPTFHSVQVDPQLPVRSLDPARDHPRRVAGRRERRDRDGLRRDRCARDVQRSAGRLEPEHASVFSAISNGAAGDQPVERTHVGVVLERRDREPRRARRPAPARRWTRSRRPRRAWARRLPAGTPLPSAQLVGNGRGPERRPGLPARPRRPPPPVQRATCAACAGPHRLSIP